MKSFSAHDRQKNILQLEKETFDLVIIGGGINGAGVARDAALRGMKVALIESSDFASGTSSRSSKMIHGGIRYLENLEFHLVFEALSERSLLFDIAPHLVHHLRFLIPLYKSGRVGMLAMGLGMWLYDALALFQAPELHERLSVNETKERFPLLQSQDLLGSYVYSDGYMDDDRLVIETLRSANLNNACCVNYVKATSAEFSIDGKVKSITAVDQVSKKKIQIKGRHFLSTVGPWTDQVASQLFKDWKNILRPTKGVHLTFEKKRFPLQSAVVMGTEKRIVFGIPRHEMILIGTTDTDFSGDPADVVTTDEDVRYLLSVSEKYFPGARLKKEDIVSSYAGVRPLVKDDSESEGKTSREHTIFTEPYGVTFVAGGKYTTYRLIAKQAVQEILKHFPIEDRIRFANCQTHQPINPLISAESFSQRTNVIKEIGEKTDLEKDLIVQFVDRHGEEARTMVQKYGLDLSYIEYEAMHALENTMCLNLKDFFTRRVPLFLSQKDHGTHNIDLLKPTFRNYLSLSESEYEEQVKDYQQLCSHDLAWQKSRDK